ncbi:MAG TPA: glycosyltransferase [Syntrophales bacterium]|nr:glycosyltransferase [Syntrophales bacterium]
MKVMTAMYTIRRGGAYDRFIMMIEAFLERDCEIHCLSLTPIQIKHSLFHNHVMYFPFKTTDGLLGRLLVLSVFPLWCIWIAWRNRIDLLIAFGSLYAFIQGFSKWFLKRPMVTFIRGNSSFGLQMRNSYRFVVSLNRGIENMGLHFSDRVITNNTAIQQEVLKDLGRRNIEVQVLFNDIPPMDIREPEHISRTRDKYGIPGDTKMFVTAGILNRGKNIEVLIKCLPRIDVENLFLIVAGDGSTEADLRYKDFLQELARKLGVDKKVIFTGWLEKEELWKIYLASDLFVLPSLSEGMPNAMLEALGFNLPCMGSNIPGIRDILQYDELIFDPGDEKAVADKIQQLFSNRQFLVKVKRLCQTRKDVFTFDWKERVFEIVTSTPVGLNSVAMAD